MRARSAALITFTAFALGGASQWAYLHDVIGLPLAVVLAAITMPALALVPVVLLFRALVLRARPLAAALAVPAAATGLSWLSARLSPHGSFGHLAYSQADALPVLQLASLLGLWGVGFLVWLGPATLAASLSGPTPRQARMRVLGVGVLAIAMALGFGAWRLQQEAPGPSLRVALLAIGGPGSGNADIATTPGRQLLERYIAEIDRLAAQHRIDVFVGPESPLLVHDHAVTALQQAAHRHGARILMGVEDRSGAEPRNAALVFEPGGGAPAAYYKRHLIPGLESRYAPGTQRLLLDGTPATAVAICKDLDFTATALDHARLGAALMLVPAWDFDVDAWLHARMATMRGVEGGFAVARSARDGLLTLSDDRGRVLAEVSAVGSDGAVSVVAGLSLRATRTAYRIWGDAFGPACLLLALLLAIRAARTRRAG